MKFKLMALPYSTDALEPFMSRETLEYHYGKHHKSYVDKLNELIKGTKHEEQDLETIILTSREAIFNQAAQTWNHNFFWQCLSPKRDTVPTNSLNSALVSNFGSAAKFSEHFKEEAAKLFGSGWVWLVKDHDQKLKILATKDAENPLTFDAYPLLCCDVWEHAYYIDTRNDRKVYLENYGKLVNWSFVSERFDNAPRKFL